MSPYSCDFLMMLTSCILITIAVDLAFVICNFYYIIYCIMLCVGDVVEFAHLDDGSLNHSPINTVLKHAGVKTVEF